MAGQWKLPGLLELDVADMKVVKEAQPELPDPFKDYSVPNIIDLNEEFDLKVGFTVSGLVWENIKIAAGGLQNIEARFEFTADEVGGPDQNLGNAIVPMMGNPDLVSLGGGKFEYTYTVQNGISTNGVFNLSVMMTFKKKNGGFFPGILGFFEGLKLMVHWAES
jgi:hypothetical protein